MTFKDKFERIALAVLLLFVATCLALIIPYTLQRNKNLSFAESVVNDPDWEFYLNGELVEGTAL